jgi:hypothetical protein
MPRGHNKPAPRSQQSCARGIGRGESRPRCGDVHVRAHRRDGARNIHGARRGRSSCVLYGGRFLSRLSELPGSFGSVRRCECDAVRTSEASVHAARLQSEGLFKITY